MATGVVTWSKTAASNANSDSAQNWAEGMAPSAVNDSARGGMSSVAKWRDDLNGTIATAGTTTAYTATSNQSFSALSAGLEITCQFDQDSGTPVTLNVDGLGAKPLRSAAGVELPAGALKAGGIYSATYKTSNSGEWILQNYTTAIPAAGSVATAMLADGAVTYAKMQNVTNSRLIGRKTTGSGAPEELSLSDALDFSGGAAQGDILFRGASNWDNLATGTAGQQLTAGGSSANPSWGSAGGQLLHLQDSVSSGTAAQSLTISTWNTRRLQTTKTNEITGASLGSNQITLPAGTYEIDAWATATTQSGSGTQGLQPRLRNITGSTTLLVGRTGWSFIIGGGASQPMDAICNLKGRFTLSGSSVLEFQNYLSGVSNVTGGSPMSTGEAEVYTDVMIKRVA